MKTHERARRPLAPRQRRHVDLAALRAVAAPLLADGGDAARMKFDLRRATFGEALVSAVEDLMLKSEPLSDWAKGHFKEGLEKGKAEGKAESVLAVLTARGLSPSVDERRALLACTDLARLDLRIARALTVTSVAGAPRGFLSSPRAPLFRPVRDTRESSR
jgi:hypothetical protein